MSAVAKSWAFAVPAPAILLVNDDPFQAYAQKAALESVYQRVVRAAGAAEAFILVDQPAFARDLALVVVALHMPGLSGQVFVDELASRAPRVPVLVICSNDDCTDTEYTSPNAHLLPASSSMSEMLGAAGETMQPKILRIA
ncbi:response regulator [Terracidiphilus gabretensis]|uniref:response regulator n=1 Tax=Terracidiphilus gabretensis TaxID=1577687 RepID=UPI00071B3C77|nr:response regulator [Terracidiphilus gabretensis]